MAKSLLLRTLLVACLVASCWAAAAIDLKSSPLNSAAVEPDDLSSKDVKQKEREGHALRSDSASYSSYLTAPAPAPSSPAVQPAQPPAYSSPADSTMGYVYYYLPTVEKYYPKLRDLMPYVRSLTPAAASRAWPVMRQMADRTFDLGAAFGLVLLTPALLISSILFLVFIVFLMAFPAVSAFGKRRSGRDLSGLEDPDQTFDFDQFLPPEQSRKLATLAAQVDGYLETYKRAFMSESCLEKFSCEAGQIAVSRLGRIADPVIKFLEPIIPDYMTNKLDAFKIGARSGSADCSEFKCKVPFVG